MKALKLILLFTLITALCKAQNTKPMFYDPDTKKHWWWDAFGQRFREIPATASSTSDTLRFGIEDTAGVQNRTVNMGDYNLDITSGNPDYSGFLGEMTIVPGSTTMYAQGSNGNQSAKVITWAPSDIPTVVLQSTVGGGTSDQIHIEITNDSFTVQKNGGTPRNVALSVNGNYADNNGEITVAAGDASTANPLSQFASTTSAQLAGVMSNETGSGALVFGTSPTLVTPTLGDASLTSSSISGTAGGGFLQIANQSSAPGTPTAAGRIYFDNSNRLSWKGTNGFVRTFDGTANTADRAYTLPDAAGTLALTTAIGTGGTDIAWSAAGGLSVPDASATARGLITTGAQTIAGDKTATGKVSLTATGGSIFSVGSNSYIIRTTNGGSNIGAQSIFDVDNSVSTAGAQAFGFETSTGLFFSLANGTRRITRAALKVTNATNTAGSESGDLSFYTQTAGAALAEKLRVTGTGSISVTGTNTAAGTTGAQTINKPSGQVNFAAGASTLVVTNSLVTTSSVVLVTVYGTDATATSARVTRASGSFTITLNAAATAETAVGFMVINNF